MSKFVQTFTKEVNEYGYYFDEVENERKFGVVGKKNVYDDIQSHLDSTDVTYIKKLLLDNGGEVLDDTCFGDTTLCSKDLLTNLNFADNARQLFNSLPTKIREKYGNDIYRFAKDYKQSDFDELYPQKAVKEVKKNEEV